MGGIPETITEKNFSEMVEYWTEIQTQTVDRDNLITYEKLEEYLKNKQHEHNVHSVESSETKKIDRKSEIYKKYIQQRLNILELYKKYIINDSKIEDDDYDMIDNKNIMLLNDIIVIKKIIHDLFSKIKIKRLEEEIKEVKQIELEKIYQQLKEAQEKAERLCNLQEKADLRIVEDIKREQEELKKQYEEDKIDYKKTIKRQCLEKYKVNYSKYILNNFIGFIENIKELSSSIEDYIINKHNEKITNLQLLINNFNYEYLTFNDN